MSDEIIELAVLDGTAPAVRLDHEHLVGLPGVDVLVDNVGNGLIY